MATIEEGLVTFVETNVASIGKGFPLQVPQDSDYPAWAYEVTSDEQELTHSGPTGWYRAQVTMMFIDKTYAGAKNAANALRAALDGYKGAMGSRTVQHSKVNIADGWSELHEQPVARLDVTIEYV